MPNTASAIKDQRRNEANRLVNRATMSRIKTAKKKFLADLEKINKEGATENFQLTQSYLAKAAKKKIISKGKRDRLISRMAQKLNKVS
jgi:ribosomal protein S20